MPMTSRRCIAPLLSAFVLARGASRALRTRSLATGRIATDGMAVPSGKPHSAAGRRICRAVSSGAARTRPPAARRSLRDSASGAAGSALLVAGNAAGLAATTVRIGTPPSRRSRASHRGVLRRRPRLSRRARFFGARRARNRWNAQRRSHRRIGQNRRHRYAGHGGNAGDALALERRARRGRRTWVTKSRSIEPRSAVFVTDRDANGSGALTRVSADGIVTRVATGATAEGLAIDERRQIVYVANANDGTVAAVDARSMRVVRRFRAVSRVFSLALSPDGTRLYAISNQSAGSPFAAPGSAVVLAIRGPTPRVVARSADACAFRSAPRSTPGTQTLFVTDEALGEIDVLDARTLRPKRAPLQHVRYPLEAIARSRSSASLRSVRRRKCNRCVRCAYAAPHSRRTFRDRKLSARRRAMASERSEYNETRRFRPSRSLLLDAAHAGARRASCPPASSRTHPFRGSSKRRPTVESIAPGVEYGDYQLETTAGPLAIHVVAVEPHRSDVRIGSVVADDSLVSRGETIGSMARRTRAVAGINGDYFDIGNTNRPINMVVRDGALLQLPYKRYVLAITRDGSAAYCRVHVLGADRDRSADDAARRHRRNAAAGWRYFAADAALRTRAAARRRDARRARSRSKAFRRSRAIA